MNAGSVSAEGVGASAVAVSSGRVIVLGSANVDAVTFVDAFPQPGETVLARDARTGLGGKGANQAVAASLTGASVEFAGAVGDDASGEFVREVLEANGVGTAALSALAGALTGSAAIAVDAAGENTIIVSSGANGQLTPEWVRGESVAALFGGADAAGAAAPVGLAQGELPAAVVAEFAELCAERGARFVLNLAPVIAVEDAVLRRADPLIVNEGEALAVLGEPAAAELSVADAMLLAQNLAKTSPSVVITLGAAGAVLVDAAGTASHVASPKPARVVDTTGAGDAFVGALAARLASGDDLDTAARWGVAAGSCAVENAGAVDSYAALAHLTLSDADLGA